MRLVAIFFNIFLFCFTCLVLVTDGPPRGAGYVVLTFLLLAVPVFNAMVLWRCGKSAIMRTAASIANIVLLGFVGWASVSQYPHPMEEGFVAYMVLLLLTPFLSLAVLFRAGRVKSGRD